MKRKSHIVFLILILSILVANPVYAVTKDTVKSNIVDIKNIIKNGIDSFFEPYEVKKARENKQIQDEIDAYSNKQKAIQQARQEQKEKQEAETAKQLYDKYFSEMEKRFTKWQEYKDADAPRLQAEYDKYLDNKNNMEHNRDLCDMLDTWEKQYNEIITRTNDEYRQAYEKMRGTTVSNEEFERFKKDNPDFEGFKFSEVVKSKLKNIEKINEEVSDYSYAYEQKKVANFMATHKRKKLCGQIANFVYMPAAGNPQIGCLYSYNLRVSFPLTVVQSTPNGLLVTGDYSIGYANTMRNAFIQTNKKFVDNQILRDYGMYEYLGIMHYRSVLGVQNTVWKFRQLSMEQIRKNFDIGNKLYFYQQY